MFFVKRDIFLGLDWVVIDPPEGEKVKSLSVGVNVAWIICRDSSLWFRRGLTGEPSNVGSSWLHMVGSKSMLSIGPNDQV